MRTMDPSMPTATAVGVENGRIVYVGDDVGAAALIGPETQVIELAGRMLLPGFEDSHVHPVTGGIELGECDLNPAETREDVVRIVRECAAENPDALWVRGGGYPLTAFPGGAPSKELLDSLVPGRPAYLTDENNHSGWANSRALAIAGVDGSTPDPPNGTIVRNRDGSPEGTLLELAMDLVEDSLPPYTDAEIRAGLDRGLAMAASFGITSLQEADAENESFLRAYASAEREGALTARVIESLLIDPSRGRDQVAELAALRDRYPGRLARPVAAKIFLDGVIEGGTAALLEPYLDRPGWSGELRMSPDSLTPLVESLDSAGFKVHVHAIGDRAIRAALDAFEAQYLRDDGAGPRHIIAHLELIDPDDVPRFAKLGVVAAFQPLWAYADSYITDLTEPRLGPERSSRLYPIKSVLKTGAVVAGGSDWSVTSMNPLLAIEVGITRESPDAAGGEPWIPDERMSLDDMLYAYTMGGALAADQKDETGSITLGKSADLTVLDRDLYSIDPREISDVHVDLTIFEGRIVYRRPGTRE